MGTPSFVPVAKEVIPKRVQDLPLPDEWRQRIKQENDDSIPREPYQRCSQAVFEAWLKPRIQAEPLIHSIFWLKFECVVENADGVESTLTDIESGETHVIRSKYVAGCYGAGSRVRCSIDITLREYYVRRYSTITTSAAEALLTAQPQANIHALGTFQTRRFDTLSQARTILVHSLWRGPIIIS
jgi:2-polyprenyl-6-methoxyphenol hydroxylase-like FAD-dependent oxidoreductase